MTEQSRPFAYPTPFNWSAPIGRLQFFAFHLAVLVPAVLLQILILANVGDPNDPTSFPAESVVALLNLLVLVMLLAACARRLVDIGRSRWWVLVQLIPVVNVVCWVYLLFAKGQAQDMAGA